MSMADDHTLRSYRSNDRYQPAEPSRPSEQAGGGDPLAELARLIGQRDPFAEFGRSNARQGQRPAPDVPTTAPDDWQQTSMHEPDLAMHEPDLAPGSGYREQEYEVREDDAHPLAPATGHDEVPLAANYQDGHHDDRIHDAQHYDDRLHGGDDAGPYYQDDAPLEPHEDEMYDDAPHARRHSGLVTALALIGCAVLGTAGAYAYRSYSGVPSSTQPPPVIAADNSTPTKIVPATAGDPQSSKAVQDRLATAEREQLVSKQEEPVALSAPRPRALPVAPAQTGSAAQPAGGSEPKKVRTVTIRPDGSDVERPACGHGPAGGAGSSRDGDNRHAPTGRHAPAPTPPARAAARRFARTAGRRARGGAASTAAHRGHTAFRRGRGQWIRRAAFLTEDGERGAILLPQLAGKVPQRAWRPPAAHSASGFGQQRRVLPHHDWAICIGPGSEPVLRDLQGCWRAMRRSQ